MFTCARGEESRDALGVEPICRALQFAPSTYYERRAIALDPERASARAKSDAALSVKIDKAWGDNRKLYGARKVWHVLRRGGEDVAPLSADLRCKSPAHCPLLGVLAHREGGSGQCTGRVRHRPL